MDNMGTKKARFAGQFTSQLSTAVQLGRRKVTACERDGTVLSKS